MTDQELTLYFDRYAAAFNAFDPEAIASFYNAPCMMIQPGSAVALRSRQDVLANMQALVEVYRSQGYRRASFADLRARSLGPALVLVTVPWTVDLGSGGARTFRNTYQLAELDGAWRIVVSTTHESADVSPSPPPTRADKI